VVARVARLIRTTHERPTNNQSAVFKRLLPLVVIPAKRESGTSVLSLNCRDNQRSERRPSPLMGEGWGGGAGAAAKDAAKKDTRSPASRFLALRRCFILVPRSRTNRTYEIRVASRGRAGITPMSNRGHR
jgi:hypothetical protein